MNMITQAKREALVAEIEPLRQRVASWRSTRAGNEKMPEPLWETATQLAKVYGVSPVQGILRIDYRGLERRVFGKAPAKAGPQPIGAKFVELPPLRVPGRSESTLELEDGAGRRMRVQVNGGSLSEVLPLIQAFWRGGL
jgi:hypothetical protein